MYYTRHRTDIRNPVCNSVHPDKDGLVRIMFSIGGHFHFLTFLVLVFDEFFLTLLFSRKDTLIKKPLYKYSWI